MNEMREEICKIIRFYYREKIRDYKFKCEEDEEDIWFMIDQLQEDVNDLLRDSEFQIDAELGDKAKIEVEL